MKILRSITALFAAHQRQVEVILYHKAENDDEKPDDYFVLYRGKSIEEDTSIRARSAIIDFEVAQYVDIEQFCLDTITRDRQVLIDELKETKRAVVVYGEALILR